MNANRNPHQPGRSQFKLHCAGTKPGVHRSSKASSHTRGEISPVVAAVGNGPAGMWFAPPDLLDAAGSFSRQLSTNLPVPAGGTIGKLRAQRELSVGPRRQPGVYAPGHCKLMKATQPNEVWTIYFNGWFLMGNRQQCDLLTIKNLSSHYVLEVRAMNGQF